jgi:hypothetical protein
MNRFGDAAKTPTSAPPTGQTSAVPWPLPSKGWLLGTTTNLGAGGSVWTAIPPPYQTNTANLQFTEPSPMGSKFYRLQKPRP